MEPIFKLPILILFFVSIFLISYLNKKQNKKKINGGIRAKFSVQCTW